MNTLVIKYNNKTVKVYKCPYDKVKEGLAWIGKAYPQCTVIIY